MKTINLIGTGCTKNLFEYEPFKSNFRLKKCAHELSIWSSCDAPLGLPVDDIDKLDTTPFNRKMVNYDLNNYALKDFETNKADYFMIDLMALSFAMYKVTYNGRTTYTQNQKIGSKLLPEMVKMPEFEGLSYEQVAFEDLPAEAMVTGFDNFCDWLIKNYPTNKIIICLPKRAKKYMLASDESIHSYSEEDLSANEVLDVIIQNFTEYIKSKFGSVIYFEFDDELLAYNKNSKDRIPAAYRYSEDDFIRLGKKLCQLLTGKAVDSAPDEYNKDSQNDNQKNNNSNNSAANDYSDIHSGSVNISRRTTTQRTVIIVMLLIMLVVAIMSFLK